MAHVEDRARAGSTDWSKRWRVRWRTPDGKHRSRSFDRKQDADRFARDIERRLDARDYLDPERGRITVAQAAEAWLDTMRPPALTPATFASYESCVRVRVLPYLGDHAIASIRHGDAQTWISGLTASGLSSSSVRQAFQRLSQILDAAVADERIPRNRIRGVRLPSMPMPKRKRYLTHAEVASLAVASKRPDLVLTLAYCGLRFGEAAALHADDLDLDRRRLTIRRNVTPVGGRMVWGEPKDHEQREVPIPAFLAERLTRPSHGLLFPDARGGPLRVGNWRRADFDAAVVAAEVPAITPHGLRHTAASLAVQAGANVLAVARMLGHADPSVTLRVYADLFDSDLDAVAEALDTAARASGARPGPVRAVPSTY